MKGIFGSTLVQACGRERDWESEGERETELAEPRRDRERPEPEKTRVGFGENRIGWGGGWTGQTSKGWGGGGVGNRARGRENTAAWSWGGREERKQSVGREGKVTNRGGAGQKKGERVRGGFKRGQHDGKRV